MKIIHKPIGVLPDISVCGEFPKHGTINVICYKPGDKSYTVTNKMKGEDIKEIWNSDNFVILEVSHFSDKSKIFSSVSPEIHYFAYLGTNSKLAASDADSMAGLIKEQTLDNALGIINYMVGDDKTQKCLIVPSKGRPVVHIGNWEEKDGVFIVQDSYSSYNHQSSNHNWYKQDTSPTKPTVPVETIYIGPITLREMTDSMQKVVCKSFGDKAEGKVFYCRNNWLNINSGDAVYSLQGTFGAKRVFCSSVPSNYKELQTNILNAIKENKPFDLYVSVFQKSKEGDIFTQGLEYQPNDILLDCIKKEWGVLPAECSYDDYIYLAETSKAPSGVTLKRLISSIFYDFVVGEGEFINRKVMTHISNSGFIPKK